MKNYKGFKIGDTVKHKFRINELQNCKVLKIEENRLPLICIIDEDNELHELPFMDIEHLTIKRRAR